MVAIVEASTVMSAVDKIQHKLEQQLRKHKQKRTDYRSPALGQMTWSSVLEEQI